MTSLPTHRPPPPKDAGSAMVAALWLSLILALLSIAMITISRDALLEIKTHKKLEAAWLAAESGLSIAKYNIARRQTPWAARDRPYIAKVGDQDIEIRVQSPKGKIDLNHTSSGLLVNLLTALGYEPHRAAQMSDHILDWADSDDLVRLNGAEANDYKQAGLDTAPTNKPFHHVSELRQILDFTYADYQCLKPFVTTFAGSGRFEPAFASSQLRALMGLPAPPTGPNAGYRRASLAGQVFEISADAYYSEHTKARVTEIIRYTGIPADPVWIHRQDRTVVPVLNEGSAAQDNPCPAPLPSAQ